MLVVVDQDPFSQVECDLHVLLQSFKALTVFTVALERHGFDLRGPTLTAAPTALVDILDRIVVVEH